MIRVALMIAAFVTGAASAQDRYYRDQPHESVVLDRLALPVEEVDGTVRLTERQAIEMALESNLDLNIVRHDVLSRFWSIEQRTGIYDPLLSAGFNWTRQKTPTASVLAGGNSLTEINTDYNFALQKEFPHDGRFEFDVTGSRNRSTNFFASLVPAISTSLQALYRQSLLHGFKSDAEYEIEIARNDQNLSTREFERSAADVILTVQDRYWNLVLTLEEIDVQEKSLEAARTILSHNQARLDVGSAARLDVVEAEAEVAGRQERLIRARYSYRLAQDDLIRLITGLEDPRSFPGEIVPADVIRDPAEISEPFEDLLNQAIASRPEIDEAQLRTDSRQTALKRSRNRLRPTLEAVMGYQMFGLGGTRIDRDFSGGFINPPILDVVPGGLGDSLEQLVGGDFYGYVLGLELRLPLGNKAARAENAAAQIALDRSRFEERGLRQRIAVELRQALTEMEMNQAGAQAAAATVRLAEERLDGQQARFDVGMATTRELIEAQRDLLVAQSVLIQNRVNWMKSRKRLDQVLGINLRANGIRVADAIRQNVR